MPLTTCLDCGVAFPKRTGHYRCQPCQSQRDRVHNALPTRQMYQDPMYRSIPLVGPCHICGADPAVDPTRDHLVPVSHGGTNDPANIRIACRSCNSSRGTGQRRLPASNPRSTWQGTDTRASSLGRYRPSRSIAVAASARSTASVSSAVGCRVPRINR